MKKFVLEFTVFISGAVVMIYEIIGSRILAPFIGTSTYVWTSLIGIILAALSVGYWLGGKTADRRPNIKVLSSALFTAGGLIALTIFLQDAVLAFIATSGLILELKAVLAALILFAPASVLLGFVVPYAVKLKILSIADAGKTVGRIYAFSTVGSIFGTFLAGFFLIPFVGSVRTLYLIAGALLILGSVIAPFKFTQFRSAVVVLFVFAVATSEIYGYFLFRSIGLYDIDTEYSRVRVFDAKNPRGEPVLALATDPYFIQSAIYPDSDELALEYTKYYYLVQDFRTDIKNALMIGGAGFTFPRDFLKKNPNARIDVVEIDPGMTAIARRFFRLKDDPRMNIIHQDGRIYLNNAGQAKYDVVFLDAFGSLFTVPFQLTTIESVSHIRRVLNEDGVVIFNLGGAVSGSSSLFFQAEYNTYRKIFPHVRVFKVNTGYSNEQLQNLIIIASLSELNIDPETDIAGSEIKEFEITHDGILTDDLAPVEYFNSFAQRNYRR